MPRSFRRGPPSSSRVSDRSACSRSSTSGNAPHARLCGVTNRLRCPAARAKLQLSRAGRHVGQEAIQLHGGIGMTAEYTVGHLTARLTAIDHLLGDGRQQVRNLSRRLTSYGVVEPLP